MATLEEFKDLDLMFDTAEHKNLVTDYIHEGDVGLVKLKHKLMTTYNDDVVSTLPSCECGYLNKNYLKGNVCSECGTKCVNTFSNYSPELWMTNFQDVERWLSPALVAMINYNISTKIRIIRWISDNKYNPQLGPLEPLFKSLYSINGFERTYGWLVNNIDKLLDYLIVSPALKVKKDKIKSMIIIKDMYKANKSLLHSTHIPLLNKKMFVLVNANGMGKYGNNGIGTSLDIALDYIRGYKTTNSKVRSVVMAKIIDKQSLLFNLVISMFFNGKGGIFRKNLHGARLPFSSRNVVVPITGKHKGNSIRLPWGTSVAKFRPHILPKLIRKGYSLIEASTLLFNSVREYNKDIADILDELKEEAGDMGILFESQRNPSLERGSSATLPLDEFKKDPEDTSTDISSLISKIISGDFDGDFIMKVA